jgi:hypothetical protein
MMGVCDAWGWVDRGCAVGVMCVLEQQKGGKKALKPSQRLGGGGYSLQLNSDKGGGAISGDANMAEVERQAKITITGEAKKIPEWMKDGARQKDKGRRCALPVSRPCRLPCSALHVPWSDPRACSL